MQLSPSSGSRTPVSPISAEDLSYSFNNDVIPELTLETGGTVVYGRHELHAKILSPLKPIQRAILGEYFCTTKKDLKTFTEWYNKYKGKHYTRDAILAAFQQLEKSGYTMKGVEGAKQLYLPDGVTVDPFERHSDLHYGMQDYNDWYQWNDYDDYNNYIDYRNYYDNHIGYNTYDHLSGAHGYENIIALGVGVIFILLCVCGVIIFVGAGICGFMAYKLNKKRKPIENVYHSDV
eukprot:324512_1